MVARQSERTSASGLKLALAFGLLAVTVLFIAVAIGSLSQGAAPPGAAASHTVTSGPSLSPSDDPSDGPNPSGSPPIGVARRGGVVVGTGIHTTPSASSAIVGTLVIGDTVAVTCRTNAASSRERWYRVVDDRADGAVGFVATETVHVSSAVPLC